MVREQMETFQIKLDASETSNLIHWQDYLSDLMHGRDFKNLTASSVVRGILKYTSGRMDELSVGVSSDKLFKQLINPRHTGVSTAPWTSVYKLLNVKIPLLDVNSLLVWHRKLYNETKLSRSGAVIRMIGLFLLFGSRDLHAEDDEEIVEFFRLHLLEEQVRGFCRGRPAHLR